MSGILRDLVQTVTVLASKWAEAYVSISMLALRLINLKTYRT